MRICSNCFGVIFVNDWECGCGRQNKGMGVDQQLLKPLDVEQKLKADGWRRCAEGQGETQFCALLEAAVLAEREACAKICDEYPVVEQAKSVTLGVATAIRRRSE